MRTRQGSESEWIDSKMSGGSLKQLTVGRRGLQRSETCTDNVVALGNELEWLRTRQGSGSEWNDSKMSGGSLKWLTVGRRGLQRSETC